MTTVSPEAIWEKAKSDSDFAAMPEAMQDVLKPFLEALPTVLADQLDNKATLANIMKAKVTFLRNALENGFIAKMLPAVPDEMLGVLSRDTWSRMISNSMQDLIELAEGILQHGQELLDEQGITEDQVMRSERAGLNPEALRLYLAGELTIAKILEVQPMIIAKNTSQRSKLEGEGFATKLQR